ncbi:MAG: hypothetical protein K0U93_18340, partial [Gammaproteobacteria bacterium]|nr:hypothetical protein [Gammaproteobacteria bacterium]
VERTGALVHVELNPLAEPRGSAELKSEPLARVIDIFKQLLREATVDGAVNHEILDNVDPAKLRQINAELARALDTMGLEMEQSTNEELLLAFSLLAGKTLGLALSVGSLSWLLRLEWFFAAILSSLPVWKGLDPIPVFAAGRSREDSSQHASPNNCGSSHGVDSNAAKDNDVVESAAGRILDSAAPKLIASR